MRPRARARASRRHKGLNGAFEPLLPISAAWWGAEEPPLLCRPRKLESAHGTRTDANVLRRLAPKHVSERASDEFRRTEAGAWTRGARGRSGDRVQRRN